MGASYLEQNPALELKIDHKHSVVIVAKETMIVK